jgi:hypothetical protein
MRQGLSRHDRQGLARPAHELYDLTEDDMGIVEGA